MTGNSNEADSRKKQKGNENYFKIPKASLSSTPWSRLKDARIVHVSRAFGGKDRHSKVCTVRGLRDRRVRLSVPTAIQLYGLQDKLGFNQPSKVFDWLLNAAKNEIDELPPLPVPSGNFIQNLQPFFTSEMTAPSQSDKAGFTINSSINWNDTFEPSRSSFQSSYVTSLKDISKEVSKEAPFVKEDCNKINGKCNKSDLASHDAYIAHNLFPKSNNSFLPSFLYNAMPSNSFLCQDPPDISSCHTTNNTSTPQREDFDNINAVPLPSTIATPYGSHILFCSPGTTQSYPPPKVTASMEFDPKQTNFEMVTSTSRHPSSNSLALPFFITSQHMRALNFATTTKFFPSQDNYGG